MNIIVLFLSFMFHAARATSRAQPVAFGASKEDDTTNATLPMVFVVFGFAFFITSFCSIYVRYCSEEYTIRNPHNTSGSHHGIDPHVLATFPVMPYSAVKRLKTYQNAALQCAVCLGEFTDVDDALRLLPKCSHVFHTDCIDRWLASHVTCPTCRAKLNGEVSVEIEGEARARHVFDESSVRRGEGVVVGNGSKVCGNIDECVEKGNGCSKVEAFGVLLRSHSTGHSLERFTIELPMKQSLDDGKHGRVMMMKRSASYDVILGSGEGGEGSTSKGKNNNNKWVLSMTPPFVSCDLPNASTTTNCSGIPRFWMREERECEGRTVFQVL